MFAASPNKKPTLFSDVRALERFAQTNADRPGVWATTGTVGDLLLAERAGLRALGQVMGTSVFSLGGSYDSSAVSGELKFLTGAFHQAQAGALERLRAEAKLLSADGVVDTRIPRAVWGQPGDGLLEFSLIGTAVRIASNPRKTDAPFLCQVSGASYFALVQAGWQPVGLAIGNCAHYAVSLFAASGMAYQAWESFERTEYSQAIMNARHQALARMQSDARAVGGAGIVGVSLSLQKACDEMGMKFTCFASGTVVAPTNAQAANGASPLPILPL